MTRDVPANAIVDGVPAWPNRMTGFRLLSALSAVLTVEMCALDTASLCGGSRRIRPPLTGARDLLRSSTDWMLNLDSIHVEGTATALAVQNDDEHRWVDRPESRTRVSGLRHPDTLWQAERDGALAALAPVLASTIPGRAGVAVAGQRTFLPAAW